MVATRTSPIGASPCLALLALLGALAASLVVPGGADASSNWSVRGGGWGHGIGMSQYGAQGMAETGSDHRQILGHYYRGTAVSSIRGRSIRVLLRTGRTSVSFRGPSRACGRRISPRITYRAVRTSGGRVSLRSRTGRHLRNCGTLLSTSHGSSVTISGVGRYRGHVEVRPSGSRLQLVNRVGIEGYLFSVVPREMPSSWHAEALRAQAIAARTYALATTKGGRGFDHYDDTRSQVYGGMRAETPQARSAVRATRGRIVTSSGRPVTTYYHSTSGGHTENVENVFIGGRPEPHLKGVQDPHASGSPYHRWTTTFTGSQIERRLGNLLSGSLRSVDALERGVSPRIVRARVTGSGGSSTTTGPVLRARLGLRDTWATFRRVSATRSQASASGPGRQVIAGTTTPRASRVRLQRRDDGRWRTVAELATSSTGRWHADVPRGTWRVVVAGWAASPSVTVR